MMIKIIVMCQYLSKPVHTYGARLSREAADGKIRRRPASLELHHSFWIPSGTVQVLLQEFVFCFVWEEQGAPGASYLVIKLSW